MPYRFRFVFDFRAVQWSASVEVKMSPPAPTAMKRSLPQTTALSAPALPRLRIFQGASWQEIAIKPGSPTATKVPLAKVTAFSDWPGWLGPELSAMLGA